MKTIKHTIFLLVAFTIIALLFSAQASAQFPYFQPYFGTTSATGFGISPYSYMGFSPYGISYNYPSLYYPFLGSYQMLTGTQGLYPSFGSITDYQNTLKTIQYYQYLNYAYNFYQIARSTPMFYLNDFTADYIGSSLYSFIQNSGLAPQEGIISFIQQHLL